VGSRIAVMDENKKMAASSDPKKRRAPVKKKLPIDPLRKLKCLCARFSISKLKLTRNPRIVSFFSMEISSHNLFLLLFF
jgi:hypothetical protein